jgi:hypothetical protein
MEKPIFSTGKSCNRALIPLPVFIWLWRSRCKLYSPVGYLLYTVLCWNMWTTGSVIRVWWWIHVVTGKVANYRVWVVSPHLAPSNPQSHNCSGRVRLYRTLITLIGAFGWSRKAPVSFYMFGRLSAYIVAAPTGRISVKFGIEDFYENLLRKSKFCGKRAIISGPAHEALSTFYCCRRY